MRVTIDLDGSTLLELMAFYNMRLRYAQVPRMYRTGHGGIHLIARDLPLTWYEANEERRLFKDDESRVWLDVRCQGKPQQTLFHNSIHGLERVEMDEKALLALPVWRARFVVKRNGRGVSRRFDRRRRNNFFAPD
jgi:hypothetical protein